MKQLVRNLRKHQSDAERLLWRHLRNRQLAGFKFRRQYKIGSYIVDLICLERNLVIEIDGGQHIEQSKYDFIRTEFLESNGFKVIRFWNNEVFTNTKDVLDSIYTELANNPCPLPLKGRGRC